MTSVQQGGSCQCKSDCECDECIPLKSAFTQLNGDVRRPGWHSVPRAQPCARLNLPRQPEALTLGVC